jgi:hypothetical protein
MLPNLITWRVIRMYKAMLRINNIHVYIGSICDHYMGYILQWLNSLPPMYKASFPYLTFTFRSCSELRSVIVKLKSIF